MGKACLSDLYEANKLVQHVQMTAGTGITIRARAFDWNTATLLSFSDASFANEGDHKSQKARVTLLGSTIARPATNAQESSEVESTPVAMISWGSHTIKR
eukprot:3404213-Amphidinium_carterae.1